jgi:hypothetical protein
MDTKYDQVCKILEKNYMNSNLHIPSPVSHDINQNVLITNCGLNQHAFRFTQEQTYMHTHIFNQMQFNRECEGRSLLSYCVYLWPVEALSNVRPSSTLATRALQLWEARNWTMCSVPEQAATASMCSHHYTPEGAQVALLHTALELGSDFVCLLSNQK